jgi:putative NIF3 family GTP cyclohydrolase 1 type 2
VSVIESVKDAPLGFENAGYGRIVRFRDPVPLGVIISRVSQALGTDVSGLSVAVPQSIPTGQKHNISISSVGVCAGSGDSVLGDLASILVLSPSHISKY